MTSQEKVIERQLDTIWVQLRTDIAQAFDAAYSVEEPAGLSSDWQAQCTRWGVEHISEQERQQVRAAQKPLRGAAVMELLGVIKAIVTRHRIEAKKIDTWEAQSAVDARRNRLLSLLDRTDDELITAYRTAVLPRPGGMFAHALAGASPRPAQTGPSTTTLSCRGCGAPRLSPRDLICAYCDQQLV